MSARPADWPDRLFETLKHGGIRQVSYVPDAGHARLIDRCRADSDIRDVALTTEEEGVAMAAGAWLGGDRAALLMQSSGVGNCINMLIPLPGIPTLSTTVASSSAGMIWRMAF